MQIHMVLYLEKGILRCCLSGQHLSLEFISTEIILKHQMAISKFIE